EDALEQRLRIVMRQLEQASVIVEKRELAADQPLGGSGQALTGSDGSHDMSLTVTTPAGARHMGGRRPSVGPVAVLVLVVVRGEHDLPREVVAVLLRVEPAPLPAAVPEVRDLGAEQPFRSGVAVRDVDAGDLVVALVRPESAGRGVVRRRG